MLEYLHTKRLWLVRVKFLENGLYLLCNVLTSLLHDVEHTLKPLDFQGVSLSNNPKFQARFRVMSFVLAKNVYSLIKALYW